MDMNLIRDVHKYPKMYVQTKGRFPPCPNIIRIKLTHKNKIQFKLHTCYELTSNLGKYDIKTESKNNRKKLLLYYTDLGKYDIEIESENNKKKFCQLDQDDELPIC